MATVVDEDEEGSPSIEARILKAISHLVVVKISETEDEVDFNNEVTSLNIGAIIVYNNNSANHKSSYLSACK